MTEKDFIKITLEDGSSRIIMAANKDYYLGQKGIQVELATAEEIEQYFPGQLTETGTESDARDAMIESLHGEIMARDKEIAALNSKVAELTAELAKRKADEALEKDAQSMKTNKKTNKNK